jgi:hypothetical protein
LKSGWNGNLPRHGRYQLSQLPRAIQFFLRAE